MNLKSLSGWKLAVVLLAAGGLMGWGQAPLDWIWAPFLSFPVLLLVLEGQQGGAVFWRGFLFSFGYFLFGLYWIAHAMLVDLHQFWWALPLAVAGLPFILCLFHAAGIWATQKWGGEGLSRLCFFAALWSVAELVRGHIFTGFPWLLTGYVWADVDSVRNLAAYIGSYGLSFWAVLLASLVPLAGISRAALLGRAALALLLLIPVFLLPETEAVPTGQSVTLRLVQPNMAQSIKIDPVAREANFTSILEQTRLPPTRDPVDMVIWPETAVPFRLAERADIRQMIAASLPGKAVLVTGAIRREGAQFFNSVQVLDHEGDVVAAYDKAHLVPFGEYIPFRDFLPFDPMAGGVDFSEGPGPRTLQLDGLPSFSPLICYEAIFPAQVVDQQKRPDLLINVTNDGWYGQTHGPAQHLGIARLRAVEEGIPLIRVANTGFTAVVDSHGRVAASLPPFQKAVLDFNLKLIADTKTVYATYADYPLIIMLMCLMFVCRLCAYRAVKH